MDLKWIKNKGTTGLGALQRADGSLGAPKEGPAIYAKYLDTKVWEKPTHVFVPRPVHEQHVFPPIDVEALNAPLQPQELKDAAKSFSGGKSRRPTGVPNEVWKNLSQSWVLLVSMTRCFESLLRTRHYPYMWFYNLIFAFWKKTGQKCDPDTFRPISLFCTLSKWYIKVLLNRAVAAIGPSIRKTQYAYQKNKSINDPLYYLLRLAELLHNVNDQELHAVFLDFFKAFDRVLHDALRPAAERLGLKGDVLEALLHFYEWMEFRVAGGSYDDSDVHRQYRGVKQGDPAAAYMFIIVATVILADAALALERLGQTNAMFGFDLKRSRMAARDLGYADDLVLLETILQILQKWLDSVDEESERFGWQLRHSKVGHVIFNGGVRFTGSMSVSTKRSEGQRRRRARETQQRAESLHLDSAAVSQAVTARKDRYTAVDETRKAGRFALEASSQASKKDLSGKLYFRNGEEVPRLYNIKYLGSRVNENLENREELHSRIVSMNSRVATYAPVFRGQRISTHRRLKIYTAVHEKVLTSSAHLQLFNPQDEGRLLSAQMQGVRKALRIPSFYVTGRAVSNLSLLATLDLTTVTDHLAFPGCGFSVMFFATKKHLHIK